MRFATTLALASVLALGWAGSALAQGTGRSLDIQPGARENGMGAAGVALAEDATGVTWWNPAALGFVNRSAVEVTYAQLVPGLATDVSYDYAAFVKPVQGWGAFSAGLVFLSYGTSDQTDGSGNVIGQFSSYEVSPALSWGTRVLPDFAVGASLKFIRIQLAPSAQQGVGSTFGLDIGGLYRIPAARLNLGVNVQNLGPSVTFLNEDQKSPLSRNVKTGFAWDATGQGQFRFLVVGDFNQSLVTSKFRTYNGGAELKYGDQIAGRIGYYSDPLGDIGGLTYGMGVGWKGLALDFASIPQARNSGLPNVSKITLGYRF
jgi:hypothetical protein